MKKICVIPDLQITPECPTDHLSWIGRYIVEKKPDVVVQVGDFADMASLSSYDYGKRQHEGRRYMADVGAANVAMDRLMNPLYAYNAIRKERKEKLYRPDKHLTLGNHENRIQRAVDGDAKMEGVIGLDDLNYEAHGWTVHEYLKPVVISGISFCHYYYNPMSGRPYGGTSIDTRLKNINFSFVQGHQQTYMVGTRSLNNGRRIRGLICGAAYLHDEDYRGPQGNSEWRGVFMLHEAIDGDYGLMEVSLDYLCRRYEGMRLWQFVEGKYPEIYKNSLWMQRQAIQEVA